MSRTSHIVRALAFCLMSGFVLCGSARAQTSSSRSRVTFSVAVRLPGTLLPAGTYEFRGTDNTNTVLVFRANGQFISAVPARGITRLAAGETVTLRRLLSDASSEVVAWYFDETKGFAFIYPRAEASPTNRQKEIAGH
jgi:hypothetical protein